MSNKLFFSVLLASGLAASSFAQQAGQQETKDCSAKYLVRHSSIRKFYVAGGLDGSIFSTATIHHDGVISEPNGQQMPNVNTLGTIRYTMFLNIGVTFNFNFSPTVGLYTGVDVKNIGYIEQNNGYTLKRRTYNIGAPLGFKIGDMSNKGSYFFFGGGLDVPFNFQEKYFKTDDRGNKQRINEWFSDRTPDVMPYLFIGGCFNHHITVKAQYYPNNFLNQDYVDASGNKPYMGTNVNLILLSVGFGMNMHMHMSHKKCTQTSAM